MKPLINFGQKFNINFFGVKRVAFLFSIILIIGSSFLFFKKKFKLRY